MVQPNPSDGLQRLMQTLHQRAQNRPPNSYTTKLIDGGPEKLGAKIFEEAQELLDAAIEPGEVGREHFVYEAADLLFHTMVLLAWRGVDIQEVVLELQRREGTSGLVEKAQRGTRSDDLPSSRIEPEQ